MKVVMFPLVICLIQSPVSVKLSPKYYFVETKDNKNDDHIRKGFLGFPGWSGQCVSYIWEGGPNTDVNGLFVNSASICMERCTRMGHLFAGVYGIRCACTNRAPPTDKIVSKTECNKKCNGDQKQNCGGKGKMNVFRTGAKDTTCKESFECTKDGTCFWAPKAWNDKNGGCRCNDKSATMPECANPKCPKYCDGGSTCMKKDGKWGCQCLPSFNLIKGKCVKKQECKKSDAKVGPVAIAVDNTRGDCGSTGTNTLRGKKALAITIVEALKGVNVPKWILATFTVAKPKTDDIKKNTKLVSETTDIKGFISSINGIKCTDALKWWQGGATRVMQGVKRVMENMPKGGTIVVITENLSFDLDLTEELQQLKEEKEINILIAMSPRYHGTHGDSSWKEYVKLSNSRIFQMDKVEKNTLTSVVVKEVENSCGF